MTTSRRSEWLVPAGLVLMTIGPGIGGAVRLNELVNGAEISAANERFFAMPMPVVLHILSAIPYGLIGAFQFSSELRRRHRGWHRLAGRVAVALGLMAALSGLWMTLFYPMKNANSDGLAVYVMRLLAGTGMTMSIGLAIDAIRQRDFTAHGAWMIRAYAIGMGAGTQVFTHLPWFIFMDGKPGELPRALMMGSGWIINVLVAERIIRRSPRRVRESRKELQHAF